MNTKLEETIIKNLCSHLTKHGFTIPGVDDGGVYTKTSDTDVILDTVFSVGEAWIRVRKPGFARHSIMLIPGNGEDIVGDHSYSEGDPDGFERAMNEFMTEHIEVSE